MKIQYGTVGYWVEDALVEFRKVLKESRKKTLEEGDMFPLMEHGLKMLNFAFNARFLNRKTVALMSQEEWEKYLVPQKKIFGKKLMDGKEKKKIRYETVIFYMEEAISVLINILQGNKNKALTEEKACSLMVHAIKMSNCAFNARYVDKEQLDGMKGKEFRKYLSPPKKIFN